MPEVDGRETRNSVNANVILKPGFLVVQSTLGAELLRDVRGRLHI